MRKAKNYNGWWWVRRGLAEEGQERSGMARTPTMKT